MTDLEVSADYPHPPARVWRALTEVPLLGDWLGPCEGPPVFDAGEHLRLRLDGLADGPVDGELVEVLAPERIVMRWSGEQVHAQVTWELVPTAAGSRLTCAVSGFLGLPTGPRRQEWRDGLISRIEVGLPLVLAELEVASAAVRGALPARESLVAAIAAIEQLDDGTKKPAGPEVLRQRPARAVPARSPAPAPARRRRTWLYAGVATGTAVVLVATATALILTATRPAPVAGRVAPEELRRPPTVPAVPAEPSAQQAVGTPAPTGPARSLPPPSPAAPGEAGGPVAPAPGEAPVPRPRLSATYTVERTGLLGATGYKVTARIDNPGPVAVSDWRLAFTLRKGQQAGTVSGAAYRQDGTTVTFTPGDTVPPRGSVTVSFEVSGLLAGEPSGCVIDGRPCG